MRSIAIFIIVSLPLAVLLLCRAVPEPPRRSTPQRPRLADLARALLDTPPLRYFLATQVLFGLATGAVASLFVIYSSRYLGLGDKVPQIALPMTLAMALGMPLWLQVLKRVEKHRAWAFAALGMIAALLAVLTLAPGPGALLPMIAIMACFGFFLGLSSIALPSLLADIVDYDVWRNRRDRAAIFFSFQAVVTKLNQGIGGAVALAIPTLFGFDARQADQRPPPRSASRWRSWPGRACCWRRCWCWRGAIRSGVARTVSLRAGSSADRRTTHDARRVPQAGPRDRRLDRGLPALASVTCR